VYSRNREQRESVAGDVAALARHFFGSFRRGCASGQDSINTILRGLSRLDLPASIEFSE
jgi:hypothetical protein